MMPEEIQILDKDAYIYIKDGNYCIDYSPKTLEQSA
jgi:hypothetical protein